MNVAEVVSKVGFRDDLVGTFHLADISPSVLRARIEASKVPMMVWAGWLDGGGAAELATKFSNSSDGKSIGLEKLRGHLKDWKKRADPPLINPWPNLVSDLVSRRTDFGSFCRPVRLLKPLPSARYCFVSSIAWKRSPVRSRPGPPNLSVV